MLKHLYGITQAEFSELFLKQGSKCAICPKVDPGKAGWQVDHCHDTNVVRGILCPWCNKGLGLFQDNTNIMISAIRYLAEFQESTSLTSHFETEGGVALHNPSNNATRTNDLQVVHTGAPCHR